ncbi:MAG: hypothetical protein ABIV50_05770 [Opitutus sp.]
MNSFLQGKKVLSVAPLRPLPPPTSTLVTAAGSGPRSAPALHEHGSAAPHPTVEVIKEGDKVVRLLMVCSCGERVEIECLYPGNG